MSTDATPVQYGWACPKCGNVYAPFVLSCRSCAPVEATTPPRPPRSITCAKPTDPAHAVGRFMARELGMDYAVARLNLRGVA